MENGFIDRMTDFALNRIAPNITDVTNPVGLYTDPAAFSRVVRESLNRDMRPLVPSAGAPLSESGRDFTSAIVFSERGNAAGLAVLQSLVDADLARGRQVIVVGVDGIACDDAVRIGGSDSDYMPYNLFSDLRSPRECRAAGSPLLPFEPGETRDGFFDPAVERILGGVLAGCWLRWRETGDATWATWGRVLELIYNGDDAGQSLHEFLDRPETADVSGYLLQSPQCRRQTVLTLSILRNRCSWLRSFERHADLLPDDGPSIVQTLENGSKALVIDAPARSRLLRALRSLVLQRCRDGADGRQRLLIVSDVADITRSSGYNDGAAALGVLNHLGSRWGRLVTTVERAEPSYDPMFCTVCNNMQLIVTRTTDDSLAELASSIASSRDAWPSAESRRNFIATDGYALLL